ncbi:hypothetical protein FOMPIDRAFT_1049208 [Fomitopsis schrenkii]|uniref:Uncharacterized protein n=1 Tax=Fomitopsis schrenkii TaxID=2126942 RepID=S8E7F5_FOMSC|nr:hypothetical protein FOMPIDRAFT_1049208 [Fomitopsis schrenkii]
MSVSDASPSSSPSISPTRSRRLSARRGSVAASDPWGTYSKINNDPLRATSSRLTIVRVPKEDEDASQRRHRRHGSNASLSSNSSSGKGETSRMSFAFSSFTPANKDGQSKGSDGSPTSSPRIRPHSPSSLSRRYSGSMVHANKLSPEQLLDVARSSCNPRPAVTLPGTSPVTPAAPAPISFTPLPDSIYLPFVDRPGEVAQLMTTPPSAKLFALLAQVYSSDAHKLTGAESVETLLAKDPRQWTYPDLAYWLKDVDRDVVGDVQWVMKARACIIAKSEPLWERVKGALGVPHELDVDEEELPTIVEPTDDAAVMENEAEKYPSVFDSPTPAFAVSPASPNLEGDEMILIEPVVAQNYDHPPTSSALDPHATHELTEVREEDEDAEDKDDTSSVSDSLDPEVHGLRIMTSPASPGSAIYAASPAGSPSPMPPESPAINAMTIPRSHSFHDKDAPYDALAERGPGHPLFPSSFAHLSMRPTLGGKPNRAQSLWNPPAPAFGNPHSIRSSLAGGPRSIGASFRPFMKDWAHSYDPARHEYAIASSTGSVSALGD